MRYANLMYNPAMKKPSKPRPRGRPPKGPESLLKPMMIRLSPSIMRRLEAATAARTDGADKTQIIREVLDEHLPEG